MIKIGTSGFSFPDWKGSIYPADIKKDKLLPYYEEELGFNAVELNFTYYTLPSVNAMDTLAKKTSPDFEFVVKGYKGITHDPFDYRLKEKPGKSKVKEYYEYFYDSLEPLRKTGKLGGVLLQFPVFFYPSDKNLDYILTARKLMKQDPLILEFRNSKWVEEGTFRFLKENNISYCAVDEPALPRLMPFKNRVTSDIAYIRFHGRNTNWFNTTTEERYNYLYSEDELKEFIPEIKDMDNKAKKTYLFFNNCHAGSAATNAKMLRDILGIHFEPVNRELF